MNDEAPVSALHFGVDFSGICVRVRYDLAAGRVQIERRWRDEEGSADLPLEPAWRAVVLETAAALRPELQQQIRLEFFPDPNEHLLLFRGGEEVLRLRNDTGRLGLSETDALVSLSQELCQTYARPEPLD
ncbi:MAG TPA: hypothetical protein DEA08_12475 [Planctomycetes bacterium]|nr:hypothetical protein [Planctomycetota bacterium]